MAGGLVNTVGTPVGHDCPRRGRLVAYVVLATVLGGALAAAQVRPAGTVDPHFRPVVGVGAAVRAILPLPDGRVAIGGDFTSVSGVGRRYLAILRPDGSVDLSFDPGDALEGSVKALALAPDGRLVTGNDDDHTSCGGFDITRFNGDGSVDATITDYDLGESAAGVPDVHIQCPVYTPGLRVLGLASQQDGRILVATDGYLRHIDPATWRWDQAGDSNVMVQSLAQRADGRIVAVAGRFWSEPGVWQGQAAWLGADGSVEQVLPPSAAGWESYSAVTLQPDGKLVLGALRTEAGNQVAGVVRLHPDGTVDDSFAQTERFARDISSLAVDPDGRVVVVSRPEWASPWVSSSMISRLLPGGTRDGTFAEATVHGRSYWAVTCVASTPGGLLVGGGFERYGGDRHTGVARLDEAGRPDPAFSPQVTSQPYLRFLAPAADGRLLFWCSSCWAAGTEIKGFGYLAPDGSHAESLALEGGYQVDALAKVLRQPDGKILVACLLAGQVTYPYLVRFLSDGSRDQGFVVDGAFRLWSPFPGPMFLLADGRIVLTGPGLQKDLGRWMVRLMPDGRADYASLVGTSRLTTASGGSLTRSVAAVLPDGGLIVGGFDLAVNGIPCLWGLIRLAADGSHDPSFHPPLDDYSSTTGLVVQPDGKILAWGSFKWGSGANSARLIRLNADGSLDTSFRFTPNIEIQSVTLQPDGRLLLIVGNAWTNLQVIRLMPNGSQDTSFELAGSRGDVVPEVALLPRGDLLVSGGFSSIGSLPQPYLARVSLEPSATPRRRLLPFPLRGPEATLEVRE